MSTAVTVLGDLVWGDPPEALTGGAAEYTVKLAPARRLLRERPREWAMVAVSDTSQRAAKMATNIRAGKYGFRLTELWESCSRLLDNDSGYGVFVRYLGLAEQTMDHGPQPESTAKCGAVWPAPAGFRGVVVCTEDAGHDGQHRSPTKTWDDAGNTLPRAVDAAPPGCTCGHGIGAHDGDGDGPYVCEVAGCTCGHTDPVPPVANGGTDEAPSAAAPAPPSPAAAPVLPPPASGPDGYEQRVREALAATRAEHSEAIARSYADDAEPDPPKPAVRIKRRVTECGRQDPTSGMGCRLGGDHDGPHKSWSRSGTVQWTEGAASPPPEADACRVVEVDGEPVRVRGAGPFDQADADALTEVVRAAREHVAAMPPPPICTCGHPPRSHEPDSGPCRIWTCDCTGVQLAHAL